MAPPRTPVAYRLLKNYKVIGDCWEWTGSKTRDGYGVIGIGRKQYRASRMSYTIHKGFIPSGMCVCHTCDNPLCINPDHLFLGTHKENTQDMMKKGRKSIMIDTDHPLTKITHEQRKSVISLRRSGKSLNEIAALYGVVFQTISRICNGEC